MEPDIAGTQTLLECTPTVQRTRPIGIDLFSGAGGLSLGFEQAGFDVVAAVELDPIHACVHEFNFPRCATIARSVVGLSGDAIRQAAKIGNRPIDVVFGGAPCQGFSMIGQRALDDPRNLLAKEFVRIVAELKPRYFVFENVKGLTLGKHRRFLEEVIEAFTEEGYSLRLPWRVLNASAYGVPQERERLILIGARKGLPLPLYPSAATRTADTESKFGRLQMGPTCRDAIGDLPNAENFEVLEGCDAVLTHAWGKPSGYAKEMRCIGGLGWHYGYRRKWNRELLTSSMRTEHSEISRRRFSETKPGDTEPISRFYRLFANGVSNTLRAGTDASRGAFTSPRPIHYSRPRCITVREMARLHGFPDWFRFHETKWHGARQIGNAVPPPLARSIASRIMIGLGERPSKPDEVLSLGSEALLRFVISKASRYLGVENPIGGRTFRSGSRKRKQADIEAERLAAAQM